MLKQWLCLWCSGLHYQHITELTQAPSYCPYCGYHRMIVTARKRLPITHKMQRWEEA